MDVLTQAYEEGARQVCMEKLGQGRARRAVEAVRRALPATGYGALAGGGIGAATADDPLQGALIGAGIGAGAGALGRQLFRRSPEVQRLRDAATQVEHAMGDRIRALEKLPLQRVRGEIWEDRDVLLRALKDFA